MLYKYFIYYFFVFLTKGLQERAECFSSLRYLAVILAAAFPGVVSARGCDTSSSFVAGATTSARGTTAPSSLCVPSMNLRTVYNFPFLAAQVISATRTYIKSVARQGSMTSRHTFLMSVVCTVFNSCKNGGAINSSISSVTERSGNPAKFNFKCISNS